MQFDLRAVKAVDLQKFIKCCATHTTKAFIDNCGKVINA